LLIEAITRRKLPAGFAATLMAATVKRLRTELRAMPHAAHALTWLRGPKCVASSSPPERIRASLETTGLARFFSFLFSATDVANGKPAPDLFLHAASRMGVQAADCIVVEDSAAGVTAATTAGMTAVGFVGGSHAGPQLGEELRSAGARTIVADLRHLKSAVVGGIVELLLLSRCGLLRRPRRFLLVFVTDFVETDIDDVSVEF
jgi:HAD superfamily hydrolase (TIGR01509 family)